VHLVGFMIRIYHDARSPERQIQSEWLDCLTIRHVKERPCFVWCGVVWCRPIQDCESEARDVSAEIRVRIF